MAMLVISRGYILLYIYIYYIYIIVIFWYILMLLFHDSDFLIMLMVFFWFVKQFMYPPSLDSKHQSMCHRYNYQRQLIRAAKHRLEEGANSSRAWHSLPSGQTQLVDPENDQFIVETNLPIPTTGRVLMLIYWRVWLMQLWMVDVNSKYVETWADMCISVCT